MHCQIFFLAAIALYGTVYAQTVTIRNVSHPNTHIEVGNVVEVDISGAAQFGTVTVVQNGGAPYVFGETDIDGSWTVTAAETGGNVGAYNQHWFVNGVEMTPLNADTNWFPYAPALPDFSVYANFTGTNDPPPSNGAGVSGCGAPNNAQRWTWSPVTYDASGTFWSSASNSAASNWNGAQSRLSFSSNTANRQDLSVTDGTPGGGAYGATVTQGLDCSPCYGYTNQCNNTCFSAAGVFHVVITLDSTEINGGASAWGVSTSTFAPPIVTHEFGHSLRMNHPQVFNAVCSEVQSIMYPSGSVLFGCGVSAPTSRDAAVINSIYPSTVPVCPANQNNYCYVGVGACS